MKLNIPLITAALESGGCNPSQVQHILAFLKRKSTIEIQPDGANPQRLLTDLCETYHIFPHVYTAVSHGCVAPVKSRKVVIRICTAGELGLVGKKQRMFLSSPEADVHLRKRGFMLCESGDALYVLEKITPECLEEGGTFCLAHIPFSKIHGDDVVFGIGRNKDGFYLGPFMFSSEVFGEDDLIAVRVVAS